MRFHEARLDDVCIFQLEGEIDLHYAPGLRSLFAAKAKAHCRELVDDLSGVGVIDSTGISVLLEYLRDAGEFDGRFCVAAPTEHVRTVFEIVQLGKALPILADVNAAIAAMRSDCMRAAAEPLFHRHEDHSATAAA